MAEQRQAFGATQRELADHVGMNETHLGKIERGEGNPSFVLLIRIAGALEIDPAELVAGIGAESLPAFVRPIPVKDWVAERRRRMSGDRTH